LHLVSLGYRVPGLVRRALQSHPLIEAGEAVGPVLDLGCGTGLAALAIGDLPVGPLVGVDVSRRMLDRADAKQIYAALHESDLMTMLAGDSAHWPLIVAADVLCYFGALEEVFQAVHARLRPGGWLILSLEELLPDRDGAIPGNGDWALLRQGRYAHSLTYAARTALAAGFSLRTLDREMVRFEADAAVQGMLMVLERTRCDG
jgi:predicted TPR repeat methyltransferase